MCAWNLIDLNIYDKESQPNIFHKHNIVPDYLKIILFILDHLLFIPESADP